MSTTVFHFSALRWRKKWIWLTALIPLLFVSDILYGGLEYYGVDLTITPGVVLRGMVGLSAAYMVSTYRRLVGNRLLIWIALMALSVLPSVIVGMVHGESLFFDLSAVSKVLYLPFVTGLLVVLIQRYRLGGDEIIRFIEYVAYVLGASLLVSIQLGVEKETYGDYAFGSTGIFFAQNDMTLAFGLALLAGGYRLVMERFSWLRLILLGMSAFACMEIGTRASLGVVMGTAATAMACVFWGRPMFGSRNIVKRVNRWIVALVVVLTMIIMLIYGIDRQMEYGFQQRKIEEIAQGQFPRLSLLLAAAAHLLERPKGYDLTGEGMDAYLRGVGAQRLTEEEKKGAEVDWVDIYGAYGIGFTLLIHAFVLRVMLVAGWRFLRGRDAGHGLIAAATLLYFGHSAFAGHALTSPIPSTLMAGYFAVFYVRPFGYRPCPVQMRCV